jgi:hypothetical protein
MGHTADVREVQELEGVGLWGLIDLSLEAGIASSLPARGGDAFSPFGLRKLCEELGSWPAEKKARQDGNQQWRVWLRMHTGERGFVDMQVVF